jgi:hypothetical protein
MGNALLIALQIIEWLAANRDTIKKTILNIEALIPDAPGGTKAAAVRSFIGSAMGIESQIEDAWVYAGPVFNLFVSMTKKPVTP